MGALVHEVLYRCDLGDPDSAPEWARRLCRDRGAEALTPDVERHTRSRYAFEKRPAKVAPNVRVMVS